MISTSIMKYLLSMSVTQAELKRILSLSKLDASEDELAAFNQDLNSVLALFENIHHIDTNDTHAMTSPVQTHKALRADIPIKENNISNFKHFAPEFEDEHFIVPKVID